MSVGGPVSCPVGCPPVTPPAPPPPPSPDGAIPGSVWVTGSLLNMIDSTGTVRSVTGSAVVTRPEATPGSMWVSVDALLYVDASHVVRSIPRTSVGTKPPGAVQGSVWMHNAAPATQQLRWVGNTAVFRWTSA